jgi:hypothetical protein
LLRLSRSTILDLCLATHGRAIHLALTGCARLSINISAFGG